jgi:1-deoxy-D-xylulose-5-phosphate reductoisomerase
MRNVIVLGATGSIGTTALTAIKERKLPLRVVGLSAHTNKEKLHELGSSFQTDNLALTGEGFGTLKEMLSKTDADIVLNGISGFDGLKASVAVLESGKNLALANKESVVCGSSFLFRIARERRLSITPVDSEHSAIYELLKDKKEEDVASLVITASGGPFRTKTRDEMEKMTVAEALHHPTWKMGRKITIDSATLANKAMEVIEASGLFGFAPEQIEVVVHPQSVVHSMVRMKNGAVYAQMGNPDMTLPIISALLPGTSVPLVRPLGFTGLTLTFEKPDTERFPLLALAFTILSRKDASAIAFNAADEIAVAAFLEGKIGFLDIEKIVQKVTLETTEPLPETLDEAIGIDKKARERARRLACSRLS